MRGDGSALHIGESPGGIRARTAASAFHVASSARPTETSFLQAERPSPDPAVEKLPRLSAGGLQRDLQRPEWRDHGAMLLGARAGINPVVYHSRARLRARLVVPGGA
jgi:hypothetical protein